MEDGGGGGIIFLIYMAVIVLIIAGWWKIFTKAGEPGWAAIVPFYNLWVMTKISGTGALWFVFYFIPILNIVALFYVSIELAKSFGKSSGYGVGMALLGFVFVPMLGFGDSEYVGPGGAPAVMPPGPQMA